MESGRIALTNKSATTPKRPAPMQGRATLKGNGMEEKNDNREHTNEEISPDSHDKDTSIQAQIDACLQHCEEHGMEVVAVYTDSN